MRDDVKRDKEIVVLVLLYLGAHVLAYVLAYLFGRVVSPIFQLERIGPVVLGLLYVGICYATIFVGIGLDHVFNLFRRLSFFWFILLSYLILITPFYLLFLWLNYWALMPTSLYFLGYFVLPFSIGWTIMTLIGKAMGYSFGPEQKTMVQGSQSETASSTNQREVKAERPIVWNFADYAKRWVVGQDHVSETIQKVLIANSKLADLGNPKRQRILASFLFVGPTGVGKTETAKALAGWLEDYGYSSLRLDANQFSDREAVWTLLGSPKGYVGSDKPGLLPYAISQNPKQVILIDEIEKADQGFYQFLLQMLDEGYVIERSTGYRYYLQRAIVIITSNLENKRIAEIMETISDPIQIDIAVRKTLEDAVVWLGGGRSFRITPEFLGRIDAIIPFRSLGFEDLVEIAYRDLRGLGLKVSYETVYELTQRYYPVAREYGVRYFLKKVQEEVLTQ